ENKQGGKNKNQIEVPLEGLEAFERARRHTAAAWRKDAFVMAMFHGNDTTFLDHGSRLSYHVVTSWVITFAAPDTKSNYMVVIDEKSLNGMEVKEPKHGP